MITYNSVIAALQCAIMITTTTTTTTTATTTTTTTTTTTATTTTTTTTSIIGTIITTTIPIMTIETGSAVRRSCRMEAMIRAAASAKYDDHYDSLHYYD